jgi:helix-turn-helix protein
VSRKKNSSSIVVSAVSEPLLITTAHAAELLSMSTWEIRRLVRKGLLTHKKLSKTNWLIPMKSVRAFAEVRA